MKHQKEAMLGQFSEGGSEMQCEQMENENWLRVVNPYHDLPQPGAGHFAELSICFVV